MTLDDLKNDGHEKKHTPFVPGIISDDEELPSSNETNNTPTEHKPFVPSIESENEEASEDSVQTKQRTISMVTKPQSQKEERETVSFDSSKSLKDDLRRQARGNKDDDVTDEDYNNSLQNVESLLTDGVDNPLIRNYQNRKRQQMKEFFQAQKMEKELTGHSDFDTDQLDMKFDDDEVEPDKYVFKQIDLGAADGNTKGTDRSDKSISVLPKAKETIHEESKTAEKSSEGQLSGSDESVRRNDEQSNASEYESRGNTEHDGTTSTGEYDSRSAGNYQRGSVREENNNVGNKEEITATENAQPVDNVVEEEKVETVQENPAPVDSVDFTEDDTYTHEKGIESIKAGEAAKKEAIAAKEKAEKGKSSGVTVDMEINRKVAEFKSTSDDILDDDEIEVTDKDDEDELDDAKERRIVIKNIISEKIKPVAKKMNLQGYTVAKKGTEANNIFKSKEVPVAHWVLYNTGVAIDIQEIRGIDIERMEEASRSQFRQREMFQIIYDNIVSPKPETLDGWLKSVSFNDLDNVMMAVHIGAFADSNYIPIDCEDKKCPKKYFLTDNIPIMNMVEFKDEKVKDTFMNLYNNPKYNPEGWYTTEIIPISEDFAIGFKEPNLFNMVIEINYGEQDFKEKYQRTIAAVPFIDQIYQIDSASKELIPIEWKSFVNNPVKSYKSKILRYDKIISRFTSDELSALEGLIAEINNRDEYITYKRPEVVCPYCGATKKEAKPVSMAQMVFSRNQLAALAVSLEN